MTTPQWVSLLFVLLAHTAATFRWAGRIDVVIGDHAKEIERLRIAKHETSNQLTAHALEIENIKEDVSDLKRAKR